MYGIFFTPRYIWLNFFFSQRSGQIEAQAAQRAKDEKIGKLLRAIREYLPQLHRPGGGQTSDYLVHPTALAHLRRRFNYVCSTLLRNDSLADMSERSVLYFELMEWLEVNFWLFLRFNLLNIFYRPSRITKH
jgi:hypothetical protein